MAGPITHVYRKRAMIQFGKEKGRKLFNLKEMRYYLNNFIGVNGKIHKQTGTTAVQLTSLIRIHPDFRFYPSQEKWQYIGQLDEEE